VKDFWYSIEILEAEKENLLMSECYSKKEEIDELTDAIKLLKARRYLGKGKKKKDYA